MRTVFLSRAEKVVERKILLITCAMSARCDGVRYGTVMFTGLPSGMFMRAAMRWMSRFRTAERAKSLLMRAMCAWRNVVCSCLACCAPGVALPAVGRAGHCRSCVMCAGHCRSCVIDGPSVQCVPPFPLPVASQCSVVDEFNRDQGPVSFTGLFQQIMKRGVLCPR